MNSPYPYPTPAVDLSAVQMCVCQALDIRAAMYFTDLYVLLGYTDGPIRDLDGSVVEACNIRYLMNRDLVQEEQVLHDATYAYANGEKCHLCAVGAPQTDEQIVAFFRAMNDSVPTSFLVDFFNDPYFDRESFNAQRDVLMRYPLPDGRLVAAMYARNIGWSQALGEHPACPISATGVVL